MSKEIDNNVIIDFEFNGLPRYGFVPEIIQIKAYNCANGKSVTMNFESENPITAGASLAMGGITELENTNGFFNKEKFVEALNSIDADLDSDFVGFSVSTDRRLLWNYDIHINYAIDLQDNLRLSKYEEDLALHGCSMEVCHKLVLGEFPEASHSDETELKALIDLYEADKELFHSKTLTVYPFGENAGMPLEIYCDAERRRADGYRYNNGGLLADSLNTWVEIVERYEYEDDLFYDAYRNDEFNDTGYFTIDKDGILEFTDEESFYKCMQSDFCKFALTELVEINNLDEFDFEQEYEYEYDEYDEEEIDYEKKYGYLPDENGFIINEDGVLLQYVGKEKDIVVPDNVSYIAPKAFVLGFCVESITINENYCIDLDSFKNCKNLKELIVPDEYIKKMLCRDCVSLPKGCEVKVTSKELEQSQENDEYEECEVDYEEEKTKSFKPDKNSFIIDKNGVLEKYKGNGGNVFVSESVTSIGDKAFYDFASLTSVTIPNGVTSIGYDAFAYCESLTNATIEDSVTSIGKYAFNNCTSLTSVTIGSGVTSIGDGAFYDCYNLNAVYISDVASWCNIDFHSYSSNPLEYAKNLYLNDELVTDLVIPEGVEKINNYSFVYCESLTSVTIPATLNYIGNAAFSNCTNLRDITFPDSVTSIGSYAFYGCNSLKNITIPDSVTSIGDYTFGYCKNLKSITFEGNPKLDEKVFEGCHPKEMIVRNEEMKQHLYETGNVPEGCEVKVVEKELNKTEQLQETKSTPFLGEEYLNGKIIESDFTQDKSNQHNMSEELASSI